MNVSYVTEAEALLKRLDAFYKAASRQFVEEGGEVLLMMNSMDRIGFINR